jgi:hypothetical protein
VRERRDPALKRLASDLERIFGTGLRISGVLVARILRYRRARSVENQSIPSRLITSCKKVVSNAEFMAESLVNSALTFSASLALG